MTLIYLDSCTIIYLVEAVPPFHAAVVERIESLRAEPDSSILTSALSMLECRVRPVQEKDTALLNLYDHFFASRGLRVLDITAPVVDRATEFRARYRFKTPDAIHLATAFEHKADVFVTGDVDLGRCDELRIELLS